MIMRKSRFLCAGIMYLMAHCTCERTASSSMQCFVSTAKVLSKSNHHSFRNLVCGGTPFMQNGLRKTGDSSLPLTSMLTSQITQNSVQHLRPVSVHRNTQTWLFAQSEGQDASITAEEYDTEPINVGDVVEFNLPELVSVGLVEAEKVGEDGSEMLEIMRLVRREGMGEECYLDEAVPRIIISKDRCRFVDYYPSQRVAWSTASPHHNPHGEESEDCFLIQGTLSEACQVPCRPITET